MKRIINKFILLVVVLGSGSLLASGEGALTELPTITVMGEKPGKGQPTLSTEFQGERWESPAKGTESLGSFFKDSPSVLTKEAGGEGAPPQFLIRGQDAIQTKVFLEGVPLTDFEFGGSSAFFLPSGAVASTDVFASGVPATLGEDGLGGAIQMNLKRQGGDPHSYLGLRAGSFEMRNPFAGLEIAKPLRLGAYLDLQQSREDFAYYDDNGTPFDTSDDTFRRRTNNRLRSFSFLPAWSVWDSARSHWKVFGLSAARETEIPGPLANNDPANLRQDFNLASIKGEVAWGGGWESRFLAHSRYASDALQPSTPDSPLAPSHSHTAGAGLQIALKERLNAEDWLELSGGVRYEDYFIRLENGFAADQQNERWQFPLALSTQWARKDNLLTLTPALLGQGISYRGSYRDRSLLLISPRVGAQSRWRNVRLRSSLGFYSRAPSLFELYGSPVGVVANPNLSPERAEKGDLGADLEWKEPFPAVRSARLSYTYSLARAHDLIAFVQSSQLSRVGVNIGESLIQSHELAGEAEFQGLPLFLRGMLNYLPTTNLSPITYQYAKELPLRPRWRGQISGGLSTRNWEIAYRWSWQGSTYWDVGNEKRMDPTSEHGLSVAWETGSWGALRAEIRNLFDSTTAVSRVGEFSFLDNTSGYPGYPLPGRSVYFTWKYEL